MSEITELKDTVQALAVQVRETNEQVKQTAKQVSTLTEDVSKLASKFNIMDNNFGYIAGVTAEELSRTATFNKVGRSIITKVNALFWTALGWIGLQIFQLLTTLVQELMNAGHKGIF